MARTDRPVPPRFALLIHPPHVASRLAISSRGRARDGIVSDAKMGGDGDQHELRPFDRPAGAARDEEEEEGVSAGRRSVHTGPYLHRPPRI